MKERILDFLFLTPVRHIVMPFVFLYVVGHDMIVGEDWGGK